MWTPITLVVTLAAAALGAAAAPASALSLSAGTGATLTPFRPGQTATGSGSLSATSLLGWTLTVKDSGSGAGRMVSAATGCDGSDAQLTNPLTVSATVRGVTSSAQPISATDTIVASGGGQASSFTITTNYSQVIPATQVLRTGCAYNLTATFTLQ